MNPYNNKRWRKARAVYLNANPLCIMCQRTCRITAASVVDHVIPHRGDMRLFWDEDNWQALCPTCHSGVKRIKDRHGYSQAAGVDGRPTDPDHWWNR